MTETDLILTKTIKKWFAIFEAMKPGQMIEVADVAKKDPVLFQQLCKEFIKDGHEDFSFSGDYRFFKRDNPWSGN